MSSPKLAYQVNLTHLLWQLDDFAIHYSQRFQTSHRYSLLLGGIPIKGPWCVPVIDRRIIALSPNAIVSRCVIFRSGNALIIADAICSTLLGPDWFVP